MDKCGELNQNRWWKVHSEDIMKDTWNEHSIDRRLLGWGRGRLPGTWALLAGVRWWQWVFRECEWAERPVGRVCDRWYKVQLFRSFHVLSYRLQRPLMVNTVETKQCPLLSPGPPFLQVLPPGHWILFFFFPLYLKWFLLFLKPISQVFFFSSEKYGVLDLLCILIFFFSKSELRCTVCASWRLGVKGDQELWILQHISLNFTLV